MSTPQRLLAALALAGALVSSGCGKSGARGNDDHDHAKEKPGAHAHDDAKAKDGHDHDHDHGAETDADHAHDHDEGRNAAARYEEGLGLELASETATAIGLTTAVVESRRMTAQSEITATVFDAGPPARASALVPLAVADDFARDPRVLSAHRDTLTALGQVELVVAAPGTPAVGTTLALELRAPPRDMLSVPRTAVLRTATGVFVYVQHGKHWSRTVVTIGASDGEFTAITDGLAAGGVVAATAVEHLWLTELRLTKGGGHSH